MWKFFDLTRINGGYCFYYVRYNNNNIIIQRTRRLYGINITDPAIHKEQIDQLIEYDLFDLN